MTAPEPSLVWQFVFAWVLPYFAYFVGIYIRKTAMPGKDSPLLRHQLLLGIPIALIGVSPLITLLHQTMTSHVPTYLFTLGVIVEHGMLVQETASKHLQELKAKV
jgi:CDP-diglyceride synthetase